jgi:hypothetical protein
MSMRASNYPMTGTSDVASNLDWLFWSSEFLDQEDKRLVGAPRRYPSRYRDITGNQAYAAQLQTSRLSIAGAWTFDTLFGESCCFRNMAYGLTCARRELEQK